MKRYICVKLKNCLCGKDITEKVNRQKINKERMFAMLMKDNSYKLVRSSYVDSR